MGNVYAPNVDSPAFFQDIFNIIKELNCAFMIIRGDFNVTQSSELDRNSHTCYHPKAPEVIKIALCGLRWFKLNVSKYQKRCQVVKKMSSCQKDVKCQKMKHLDYGGGSQKN